MTASAHPALFGELLSSVSRSFYLTLRLLPRAVRLPISLAYLLARTSDTIADTSSTPAGTRLRHLDAFGEMLNHGADAEKIAAIQDDLHPAHAGERNLISRLPDIFQVLTGIDSADRAEILFVLENILQGQRLDLSRFNGEMNSLADANALNEYTYLVAGCVGEFWTRICFMHLKNYAADDLETMSQLGIRFGQGLQLVNILRDLPRDLDAGRCYLPADELAAAGVTPGEIRVHPQPAGPVVDRWREIAGGYLEQAGDYIHAIRIWRIRYACILPREIGVRTLALLQKHPPLETEQRIKVPRSEVRWMMLRALPASLFR
jgi:farnesyl-diphosphate farnesyltransferase